MTLGTLELTVLEARVVRASILETDTDGVFHDDQALLVQVRELLSRMSSRHEPSGSGSRIVLALPSAGRDVIATSLEHVGEVIEDWELDIRIGASRATIDAIRARIAETLTSGGWITHTSKDGAVQIFQRDGAKHVLRSKNSSGYAGWTADFTPAGSTRHTLEIRLGYAP